jgi:hydroxymethylglutaryl-CoA lyase
MDKLIAARAFLAEGLPGEPVYGHVPEAGVPKNYRPARTLSPALSQGRG